ncbi:WD40 repeat-like protein [Dendrothele bispora CBS 962.96]|uniref:WD40 repeat-like protein n=1 Tax=Dendrothele bispora (strain CBS 962.96) TaxID=1314807 RepID=A0A4S8MZP1_DENBC|nr:WD40 repeat-like protein [Dendrothele bispora CBS 962.96]
MSSTQAKDESEEIQPPQRPPSPPPHTTFAVRGVHVPNFSAFKPRDYRIPGAQAMNHVAWNCDGKKLAAVGVDKITRVWQPEKSMDARAAQMFSGGHSDEVDYVSWNPTHPELFCTSSQKDRRIVFWDARQSRNIQSISLKASPVFTTYSPDGKSLIFASTMNQLYCMNYGKDKEDGKEQWRMSDQEVVLGSTAIFNHAGDGVVNSHHEQYTLRVMDFPSMITRESPAAHVGGCKALALDPRGRYFASGGFDSIVNLFDPLDWICARTITSCEHSINALSFSHDGEYLAIASAGTYIDICATETGVPLHRIPTLAPAPTVTWHPSKFVLAYCGQTKPREGGPPPANFVSLFGLIE